MIPIVGPMMQKLSIIKVVYNFVVVRYVRPRFMKYVVMNL